MLTVHKYYREKNECREICVRSTLNTNFKRPLPYRVTVTEVQSRYDLSEEFSSLFRGQSAFLHQVVE